MGIDRGCKKESMIRPLTRQEIEDRLQRVIAEVGGWDAERGEEEPDRTPRWIRPADLVRKLRRFIVYN